MRVFRSSEGIEVWGHTAMWGEKERRIMLLTPIYQRGWACVMFQEVPVDAESAAEMFAAINAGFGYRDRFLQKQEKK